MAKWNGEVRRDEAPPCSDDAAEPVGFDPGCRYAKDGFELGLHACTRRDGRLVRPGEECWLEQRQQVIDQGLAIHAAEQAVRS